MNTKKETFILHLGYKTISFFTALFDIFYLFIYTIKSFRYLWFYRRQIIEQLYVFSVKTLPIVAVLSIFIGLGALVMGDYQSSSLIPREVVVNVIYKTIVIVLGPLVLALVLAGKLGAALAAEIGSMKISEQIDALKTMSLDPVGFLVMPRILAGLIMLPVITIFSNFISTFSTFFTGAILTNWISPQEFVSGLQMDFLLKEFCLGNLIKPAVYGIIICLVGSFFGLNTSGGAKGVGESSTHAVVLSAVLIIIFDYYLNQLILSF